MGPGFTTELLEQEYDLVVLFLRTNWLMEFRCDGCLFENMLDNRVQPQTFKLKDILKRVKLEQVK